MRILLVEDDSQLLMQLDQLLQQAGFSVDLADDGEKAQYLLKEYAYDAVVLDLGIPKVDGISVLKFARENDIKTPVCILTARDTWEQKVLGLDAGADDYLTKPFHHQELLARVNALIRRSSGHASSELTCGPIQLHLTQQKVKIDDQELELTAYE